MTIRVIIADDHSIIREGLKSLLENKGIEVLAIVQNGRQAVEKAIALEPDLIIMDISMPDLNGVEATTRICQEVPDTKIIALSMHSSKTIVDKMFAAGASGYLLKESAFSELYDAVQEVFQGNIYLTPAIAGMYKDSEGQSFTNGNGIPRFNELSKKELEVLQLVAEGGKTKDIAEKLCVSIKTIESHRRNIMKKLNIFNIAGLTKFAIKEEIISLE
jgi:DNA-binding NarL/FixJ family response regulator